jgi:predicted flavoprotein YhiN
VLCRGEKQLLGPFSAGFGPSDTRRWFTEHGVQLKTEPDGRMFPVTDSSQTVIDALQAAARAQRVRILCEHMVSSVELTLEGFILRCRGRDGGALDAHPIA